MWITLDKNTAISLSRQIYYQIKNLILVGSLTENDKLPSSRELSRELNVSRNTILEAYDQLIAEGYLQGYQGSKTVVAKGISKYNIPVSLYKDTPIDIEVNSKHKLIDFRSGVPDLTQYPKKEIGKLYQVTCNELPSKAFLYHNPAGVMELRKAIADYLFRTRGISCNTDRIMIVSGSTQGLSIISRLLYENNKEVLMEDPTHHGLMNVISKIGFTITGVTADDYGINTNFLKPSHHVAFIYTTPSHQYPLGGILPIQRRLALIRYAMENDCYIVEDDYDSEFRYEGSPISSLYELNPQKVIYVGTFSKILSPSIRLGYLILPPELVTPYMDLKKYTDVHTESLSQYVLAKFIENGGLEKNIFKMRKVYSKKRQHLINELNNSFPNEFEIKGQSAGLHLIIKFKQVIFNEDLVNKIYLNNVKIYPVGNYEYQNIGNHKNEVLLGYAHLEYKEITDGIKILSKIIHNIF
jgi:GntR family transcriptional regulator / MocR family aminotransferase